jgi:hypothetical protein
VGWDDEFPFADLHAVESGAGAGDSEVGHPADVLGDGGQVEGVGRAAALLKQVALVEQPDWKPAAI